MGGWVGGRGEREWREGVCVERGQGGETRRKRAVVVAAWRGRLRRREVEVQGGREERGGRNAIWDLVRGTFIVTIPVVKDSRT